MRRYDRRGAELALVTPFREQGIEATREALCRWAPRTVLPNGHGAIAVAQYLAVLGSHDWYCAETALRHLAYSLATPDWRHGEGAYRSALERVRGFPLDWRQGVVDDESALSLLALLRQVDEVAAVDATASVLSRSVAPQSVWTATFLRAAEAAVYGGDEHAITAAAALYALYRQTTSKHTQLLLTLVAPAWATRVSSSTGAIETIARVAPPEAEVIVGGDDPELQLAQALG